MKKMIVFISLILAFILSCSSDEHDNTNKIIENRSKGLIKKITIDYDDSSVNSVLEFIYDNNKLLKIENNACGYEIKYTYNGNLITRMEYLSHVSNNILSSFRFEYDNQERIIKQAYYDSGEYLCQVDNYHYYDNGLINGLINGYGGDFKVNNKNILSRQIMLNSGFITFTPDNLFDNKVNAYTGILGFDKLYVIGHLFVGYGDKLFYFEANNLGTNNIITDKFENVFKNYIYTYNEEGKPITKETLGSKVYYEYY